MVVGTHIASCGAILVLRYLMILLGSRPMAPTSQLGAGSDWE